MDLERVIEGQKKYHEWIRKGGLEVEWKPYWDKGSTLEHQNKEGDCVLCYKNKRIIIWKLVKCYKVYEEGFVNGIKCNTLDEAKHKSLTILSSYVYKEFTGEELVD